MSDDMIRRVVVVGGGATGWLSALFLKKFLGQRLDVTVVASSFIPPMSVGEATNGPFTTLLDSLDITDTMLIRECDATLKVASQFAGWHGNRNASDWIHEFQPSERVFGVELFHYWLNEFKSGKTTVSYADACFNASTLVRHFKSPFMIGKTDVVGPYGYHLDQRKMVLLLSRLAHQRGITILDGTVEAVSLNENGFISHLILADGRQVPGDFFLDCTGFRAALMQRAYGVETESFSESLLCDRAVAVTLPRTSGQIRPSTLGTALENGWVWDIPLRDRDSFGYVYSSSFISDDEATQRLGKYCGYVGDNFPVVRWTPGMRKRAWVKNCVCLGVSNCFFEPIESLTSATLTLELRWLLILFPNRQFHPNPIERYNRLVRSKCEDNRDFIAVHYRSAGRTDTPFWRANTQEITVSRNVHELLDAYPDQACYDVEGIYETKAFFGLFSAKGVYPKSTLPLLGYLPNEPAQEVFERIAQRNREIVRSFPSHHEYLRSVCDECA
jgi:tryptophan halogenase